MEREAQAKGQAPQFVLLTSYIGDHIAVAAFNRPEARNAVNAEVAAELHAFVLAVEANPKARVGILTGNGPIFCAGADLKEVSQGRDIRLPRLGGFAGFANNPRAKPWIVAMNGSSYGGGTELLLACELAVMAEGAVAALSEVKRGLVPLGGGAIRLPRRLPPAIANEILLTGEPIKAQRAYDLGLVNRVVPADRVMDEAIALAEKIAEASPFGVRTSLRLARQTLDLPIDEMWRINNETLDELYNSPDFREGPRAFVEKRKPVWHEDS
jgi:enoyl-CoA hydratase/carnithine racemase